MIVLLLVFVSLGDEMFCIFGLARMPLGASLNPPIPPQRCIFSLDGLNVFFTYKLEQLGLSFTYQIMTDD